MGQPENKCLGVERAAAIVTHARGVRSVRSAEIFFAETEFAIPKLRWQGGSAVDHLTWLYRQILAR